MVRLAREGRDFNAEGVPLTCRWTIPEPQATADVPTQDGAHIILRRYGNSEGPRLVLSHGNGLAIDLYDFRNHAPSLLPDTHISPV